MRQNGRMAHFEDISERLGALEASCQRRLSRSNPLKKEFVERGASEGRLLVSSRKYAWRESALSADGINIAFKGIRDEQEASGKRFEEAEARLAKLENAEWPEDHAAAIRRCEAGLAELKTELRLIRDEMDGLRSEMQEPVAAPELPAVSVADVVGLEDALGRIEDLAGTDPAPRSLVVRASRKGSQDRFKFEPGQLVVERDCQYTVMASEPFSLSLMSRGSKPTRCELGSGPACLTLSAGVYRLAGVCKNTRCLKLTLHFFG